MMRSLFLFDMTFWLYLAALGLYVAYLFAKQYDLPVLSIDNMQIIHRAEQNRVNLRRFGSFGYRCGAFKVGEHR